MTPPDQETRVRQAKAFVRGREMPLSDEFIVGLLEAADREPWPTDESVDAHRAIKPALDDHIPYEVTRTRLRAALVMDPIIREAVMLRYKGVVNYGAQRLVDAVKKAGL